MLLPLGVIIARHSRGRGVSITTLTEHSWHAAPFFERRACLHYHCRSNSARRSSSAAAGTRDRTHACNLLEHARARVSAKRQTQRTPRGVCTKCHSCSKGRRGERPRRRFIIAAAGRQLASSALQSLSARRGVTVSPCGHGGVTARCSATARARAAFLRMRKPGRGTQSENSFHDNCSSWRRRRRRCGRRHSGLAP